MCLIALAAALIFAVVVPRRGASEDAPELALLPHALRNEPERSAA